MDNITFSQIRRFIKRNARKKLSILSSAPLIIGVISVYILGGIIEKLYLSPPGVLGLYGLFGISIFLCTPFVCGLISSRCLHFFRPTRWLTGYFLIISGIFKTCLGIFVPTMFLFAADFFFFPREAYVTEGGIAIAVGLILLHILLLIFALGVSCKHIIALVLFCENPSLSARKSAAQAAAIVRNRASETLNFMLSLVPSLVLTFTVVGAFYTIPYICSALREFAGYLKSEKKLSIRIRHEKNRNKNRNLNPCPPDGPSKPVAA